MAPRLNIARTLTALLLVTTAAGCAEVRCGPELEPVTIGEERFCLEVAADEVTRERGLMHRESIPADGGMLFVFPDAQLRSFWMAYCLVDIDLVFLDAQGRVTALHRMTAHPPRPADEPVLVYEDRMRRRSSYGSRFAAEFALEFRAGTLDRLGLHVEDKILLDLPRLKAMAR